MKAAHPAPMNRRAIRKHPEHSLDEKELRFWHFFQNADLAFFQSTPDGKVVAVNPRFAQLFGYESPADAMAGMKRIASEIFTDPKRRAELVRLGKKYPRLGIYECLSVRKDGSTFRSSLNIRPVVDSEGRLLYFEGYLEDITGRKQMEEALRENEERFRKVFEEGPIGMALSDSQRRFNQVNASFCSMLGYTESELIGRTFRDITHPEDVEASIENISKLQEGEISFFKTEKRYLKKNGEVLWGAVTVSIIRRTEGEILFLAMVEDITARRQAEETLARQTRDLLDREFWLTESQRVARIGSYQYHISTGYWQSTGMLDEIFGIDSSYRKDTDGWLEIVHPDQRQEMAEYLQKFVIGERKSFDREYRILRLVDRQERWVHGHGELILNPTGNPVVMMGTIQDITERKQVEQALAESEEKYRTLVESAEDAIALTDLNGKHIFVNGAYYTSLGYEIGDDPSQNGFHIVHPDDKLLVERLMRELMEKGVMSGEYRVRHRDGHWVYRSTRGTLIRDRSGRPVSILSVIRDITQRKQAEEKIQFLSRFPNENPNPVLRFTPQGNLLYANKASEPLLAMWGIQPGQTLPADWQAWVFEAFESGQLLETDFNCGERMFSCVLAPIKNAGYVNVYGNDITARKQMEIELAKQTNELRRRNEELNHLSRASGSLLSESTMNLRLLAEKIVMIVQQEFGQANCSLILVHKGTNELTRLAVAGPYADQVKSKMLDLTGPGVIAQAIRTGRVQNIPDVHTIPNYIPGWDIAQSELAIPLRIGNSVIGAIDVQSSETNAFNSDDERIMTIFAERAALALEHGRLNAQTETRMRQLISMRTVDMAISSSFDLDPVMNILLDQVTRQLGVHAADALTYDAGTQTFLFICGRGFRKEVQRHTRLWLGESLAGRVAQERQTISISDLREQSNISYRFPDISFEQFITYAGIPLIAKGQLKGVLEIFHREHLEFDQDEYRFLEMLASQLAIAIDNTELFENLQKTNADLMIAYDSTLEGWANALELRDEETEGHTRYVSWLAVQLAQALKVKEENLVHIYRGAVLHDIGKMGVPDSIILKPGPLTEAEMAVVRRHPQLAYNLLSPIIYLRPAIDIPYCHHEKWDGTGYPRGLSGEQIPLAARIFAVVDVWDALTSDRPYRKAWSREKATKYIEEQAGSHFDPAVAGAFLNSTFKEAARQ